MNQIHYLPLTLPFFFILVGVLILLVSLLEVGLLRHVYMRLGLSGRAAMLVLLGSLIGSYFNIPVAKLPAQRVLSGQVIDYYGMEYVIPAVVQWPGTVIAVNVGGAAIPGLMSLYLLVRHQLWARGAIAVVCVAAVTHHLARPVPGLGIALPIFVPALSTAIVALFLSLRRAAPLAYIGGSMGTLLGADLLNLGRVQHLGAPVASIGGAGTFDGIFVTGVLAVLIAGFAAGSPRVSGAQ